MYKTRLTILLLVCIAVSGCFSGQSMIHDYELYESGKPKSEATSYYYEGRDSQNQISHSHLTEYFENGHLKTEEWSMGINERKPLFKLTFHENGQLKSEERFFNGELVYGIYYTQEGQIEQTYGELINWITKKDFRAKRTSEK